MAKNINRVVILNNIRSNENVGSIFRTADAVGVSKIILCGYTPAPIDRFGRENRGLTKASLGAEKFVKWESAKDLKETIAKLKNQTNFDCSSLKGSHTDQNLSDFLVVGIEQNKKAVDYRKIKQSVDNSQHLTLIFGNEVDGLSKTDLKLCDLIAEVPIRGSMVRHAHHPRNTKRGKESLNVAVCAGVVLYSLL